ncbi:cytochrome P450 monooxygenase [Nemania abortiva]|nr:cytochrome P450 monooxygenase [Nemania abortiva]
MDNSEEFNKFVANNSIPVRVGSFVALLVICYFLWSVVYNLFISPLRHIPGPRLWAISPIFQAWSQLTGYGHKNMLEIHKKYGTAVRVGPNAVAFSSSQAWKDCNGHRKSGQSENLKEPSFFNSVPQSLITADSQNHRHMRRLIAHGFSQASMIAQEPLIRRYVDLLFQRLREHSAQGKPVDVVRWYNYTTFDIIGDLTFGESFGCLESSTMHSWVAMIFKQFKEIQLIGQIKRAYPFSQSLVNTVVKRLAAQALRNHKILVENKVKQRLALEGGRPDFMNAMITPDAKGQPAMSYQQLLDNADLLIGAGSETTATTLSGITSLLCAHPDVYAKMYNEVKTTFATEEEITLLSVQSLDYMKAVIDEGLRIYPAAGGTSPRVMAEGGGTIDGIYLPAGTIIDLWHWSTYHDPANFKDPESFIPERWLGDPRFDSDDKEAFQPFSLGGRNCIGKNLAYSEMKLILARLTWNYDIALEYEKDKSWAYNQQLLGLWSKPPLFIRMVPRDKVF